MHAARHIPRCNKKKEVQYFEFNFNGPATDQTPFTERKWNKTKHFDRTTVPTPGAFIWPSKHVHYWPNRMPTLIWANQ